MYALILAGGQGTRLWPRSRQHSPKQLLDLVAESTMLQETYERLRPVVEPDNVLVVTNATYAPEVRRQLRSIPPTNVIVEPSGRNTAPAIGLGLLHIKKRDPHAVVAVLSADHLIQKKDEFLAVLATASSLAHDGYLVTIGIKPTRPETGYGYIELGEPIEGHERAACHVARFTEKPTESKAAAFFAGGRHLWNSGMFVWSIASIEEAFRKHLPSLYSQLASVEEAIGTAEEDKELAHIWRNVEAVSIDVGIMEKAKNVAVVPADLGWSDIGSWASLAEVLSPDKEGNIVIGANHVGVDTRDSLIYGRERLIATVGVRDLIIVDAGDAVLVCPKDRAQEVKTLVEELKRRNKHDYL